MSEPKEKNLSVIFFGTHIFATVILQALIDHPHIDVQKVITQPDRPVGRKKIITPPPVKLLAQKHTIPVDQPASLKTYTLEETYDIGITAQYGGLIPPHILDSPTHNILNVHTSLLPKYRGATPIQSALIHGDDKTGVTIMKMGVGLDTGPILLQKSIDIDKDDTYPMLDKKLAQIGTKALIEAIVPYAEGTLLPQNQDERLVSHCKQFSREDGRIDWNKSAKEIYNQYRGMTPWPGIWTTWNNKRLKLIDIQPIKDIDIPSGKVHREENILYIGCTNGAISVLHIQLEGKPQMDIKAFITGYKHIEGEKVV